MAAPGGRIKKQFGIILTMILILGIFTPFLSGGFKLDLSGVDELQETDEYERLNEDFQNMYIEKSSENMEEVLAGLMEQEGLLIDKIDIVSRLDEYNSLEIEKVMVYLSDLTDTKRGKIQKIIEDNLPGAVVEFAEEDSSGYKNIYKKNESIDSKAEPYEADSDTRHMRDSADTSF